MIRTSIFAAAVGLSLASASTANAFFDERITQNGTKLTGIAFPSAECNQAIVAEVRLPSGETLVVRHGELSDREARPE